MKKTAFRIATIILASFAVAFFFSTAAWHSSSAEGASEKGIEERSVRVGGMDRSKLQSLQRDLIETLRVLRSALEQQRRFGFVTPDDLVRENIELLRAELETRETNADRLVVLERIAGQYKELENNAALVAQTTQSNPNLLLQAKADSLKAEIAAERCRLQIEVTAKN
jgi:hypothetical protein